MTKKSIRIIAVVLILFCFFNVLSINAFAEVNSSAYIFMTGANLLQGNSAGQIIVSYTITGMGMMDTIGALLIRVYNNNGTLYATIYGSTSNGLLKNNSIVHAGTYTVNCVAGNSYYCEVTLIAAKNGDGDTRTLQTRTVVAPTSP